MKEYDRRINNSLIDVFLPIGIFREITPLAEKLRVY